MTYIILLPNHRTPQPTQTRHRNFFHSCRCESSPLTGLWLQHNSWVSAWTESQGLRVRIPLATGLFSHFYFSLFFSLTPVQVNQVPNSINILQACIYKAVNTGLFLKITFSPKYYQIKCGNDRQVKFFVLKSENKTWTYWNRHYLLLHVILKIGLFLQTCKHRPVKRLQHWLQ